MPMLRPGLIALAGALSLSAAPGPMAPRAATQGGVVEGRAEAGLSVFRGIPYAAPPVGALRWRAPQPAPGWAGVRPAHRFGPACPQVLETPTQLAPLGPTAEDCLTLNIWAPADRARRHPVMVWLHGGGFVAGSGSEAPFDGSALARRGVVLVTVNYRLGRLGFFAHPALAREAPEEAKGNYGLLDQIAALRWVRANIAAFGGDPANVTVFGESAGGMSIAALMTAPAARGLFAKAIVQSGAIFLPDRTMAEASAEGAAWAGKQGVEGEGAAALAALRALPVERIAPSAPPLSEVMAIMATSRPMLDGRLLRRSVVDTFQRGEEARVPLLIGSNALETRVWLFGDTLSTVPFAPETGAALTAAMPDGEAVAAAYARDAGGDRAGGLLRLASDAFLGAPTRWLAGRHAARAPTWLYRFYAVPAPARGVVAGAPHGTDIFYVFGTVDRFRFHPERVSAADRALSARMLGLWTDFAKKGVPASERVWPRYAAGDKLLLVTNEGARAAAVPHAAVLSRLAGTLP